MRLACSAPYLVLPPFRFAALVVLAQWMRRLADAAAALCRAAGGGDGGGSSCESLLLGDDAATATDGGAAAFGGEEGAAAPRLAHSVSSVSNGGSERDRGGLDRVQTLGVMRARAADLGRADASVFTRTLNPVYATEVRTCRRCRRPPRCQPNEPTPPLSPASPADRSVSCRCYISCRCCSAG